MSTEFGEPRRPRGLGRTLYRLPIWLFRAGLSWLLGGRFLLLNHTGRKSGLPRQAVLEVVEHDPETNTYIVASGWGRRSDWYRNILKTPEVTIQVGRRRLDAVATPLSPGQGEEVTVQYARRHPTAIRNLARMIGYRLKGTEEEYRKLGREAIPFVALRPRL